MSAIKSLLEHSTDRRRAVRGTPHHRRTLHRSSEPRDEAQRRLEAQHHTLHLKRHQGAQHHRWGMSLAQVRDIQPPTPIAIAVTAKGEATVTDHHLTA